MKKIIKLVNRLWSIPLVSRALHTFWQTFVAVWLVSGFKLDKITLIAAIGAALSAVKTLLKSSVSR